MVSRETSCFSDLLMCGGREEEFETVQPPTAEEELIEQCEQQLNLHEVNVQTALSSLKKYSVYSSRINEEILMRSLDDLNLPTPDFSQNNCITRFYKELKTAAGNYVPFRLQVMFVLLCSGDLSEKIQILADLLDPDCEDQIQKVNIS